MQPATHFTGLSTAAADAGVIVRGPRVVTSVVVPSVMPDRNPEHQELFPSGLRLAVGETGW